MSTVFAMAPQWLYQGGASDGAIVLYLNLAHYGTFDPETAEYRNMFPSRASLAKAMNKSVRTISTLIRELEDIGALVKVSGQHACKPNQYTLRFGPPPLVNGGQAEWDPDLDPWADVDAAPVESFEDDTTWTRLDDPDPWATPDPWAESCTPSVQPTAREAGNGLHTTQTHITKTKEPKPKVKSQDPQSLTATYDRAPARDPLGRPHPLIANPDPAEITRYRLLGHPPDRALILHLANRWRLAQPQPVRGGAFMFKVMEICRLIEQQKGTK